MFAPPTDIRVASRGCWTMSEGIPLALVGVVVAAVIDRIAGRPRHANPYNPITAMDAHAAWSWGWDEADALIPLRLQQEAKRWLREAA
jgi:hypothetical protein